MKLTFRCNSEMKVLVKYPDEKRENMSGAVSEGKTEQNNIQG